MTSSLTPFSWLQYSVILSTIPDSYPNITELLNATFTQVVLAVNLHMPLRLHCTLLATVYQTTLARDGRTVLLDFKAVLAQDTLRRISVMHPFAYALDARQMKLQTLLVFLPPATVGTNLPYLVHARSAPPEMSRPASREVDTSTGIVPYSG